MTAQCSGAPELARAHTHKQARACTHARTSARAHTRAQAHAHASAHARTCSRAHALAHAHAHAYSSPHSRASRAALARPAHNAPSRSYTLKMSLRFWSMLVTSLSEPSAWANSRNSMRPSLLLSIVWRARASMCVSVQASAIMCARACAHAPVCALFAGSALHAPKSSKTRWANGLPAISGSAANSSRVM